MANSHRLYSFVFLSPSSSAQLAFSFVEELNANSWELANVYSAGRTSKLLQRHKIWKS